MKNPLKEYFDRPAARTKADVAQAAGLQTPSLFRIIAEKAVPFASTAHRIAKVTGIDVGKLCEYYDGVETRLRRK